MRVEEEEGGGLGREKARKWRRRASPHAWFSDSPTARRCCAPSVHAFRLGRRTIRREILGDRESDSASRYYIDTKVQKQLSPVFVGPVPLISQPSLVYMKVAARRLRSLRREDLRQGEPGPRPPRSDSPPSHPARQYRPPSNLRRRESSYSSQPQLPQPQRPVAVSPPSTP